MNLKRRLVLLAAGIIVSGAACCYGADETVKIVLSSGKDVYTLGEPVDLTIALVNMTGLDKSLNVRVCPKLDIDSYVYISVKDEAGKKFRGFLGSGEDITTFHMHSPYILNPREEKRFKFSLENLFAAKDALEELPVYAIAAKPGSYIISAGISEIALESPPIVIKIIERPKPQPKEPAQAAQEPVQPTQNTGPSGVPSAIQGGRGQSSPPAAP